MLASFTEGDLVEQQEKDKIDGDYLSKSLTKKKSILQMAESALDSATPEMSASTMLGKANKSVFKNLLNF